MKNITNKYITSLSKKVYIDKLDNIIDKYNDTYNRTIKLKPTDINTRTYIDYDVENNDNDSKFKVGDDVRKWQNIKNNFVKSYTPNWSKEVFMIENVKNTVAWTYVIADLKGEGIIGTLYEKECKSKSNRHCVKSAFSRIRTEYEEIHSIRTRKNPNTDTFHGVRFYCRKSDREKCEQLYVKWKDYNN